MDFSKLKEKALELKSKAATWIWKFIDGRVEKLQESEFVFKKIEDLDAFVLKSKNTIIEDWRINVKRVIVVFAELNTDFYKKILFRLPVLYTKSWSSNIELRMSALWVKDIEKYDIKSFPSLVLFEDTKVVRIVEWEENIKKVVNSLSLDINKVINDIK
jgi:hypothetical protein